MTSNLTDAMPGDISDDASSQEDIAQRIAQGTRRIVDAMEEGNQNTGSTFEEDVEELAKKSVEKKAENQKQSEEDRDRIRKRFAKKWQRL